MRSSLIGVVCAIVSACGAGAQDSDSDAQDKSVLAQAGVANPPPRNDPNRAPRRIALLIGIGDYQHFELNGTSGQTDLLGPANDLARMRHSLARFGFEGDDVRTIRDEQASRAGILEALQWLASQASDPEDAVVVYYSGHGASTRDVSGDEADGRDEVLIPYDARQWTRETDPEIVILDDEIGGALDRLGTANVTIIIDACFSGTLTRGGDEVDAQSSRRARGPTISHASADPAGMGDVMRDEPAHILLTASTANQVALEDDMEEGEGSVPSGVFTYHLTRALAAAGATTSYRSLMSEVRRAVRDDSSQDPQLEGMQTQARLFHVNTAVARRPFARVTRRGDRMQLDVGAVHGIRAPSYFDVFGPDEVEFASSSRIAQVEVQEVSDTTSLTTAIANAGEIPANARAVLARVPPGAGMIDRIQVFVDPTARAILPMLDSLRQFVEVGSEGDADVHLEAVQGVYRVFVRDREVLALPDNYNRPEWKRSARVGNRSITGWAGSTVAICEPLRRAFGIVAYESLENRNPPPLEDLNVWLRVVSEQSAPPTAPQAVDTVRVGERVSLYARVDVSQDRLSATQNAGGVYLTAAVEGFISPTAPTAVFLPLPDQENLPVRDLNRWFRIASFPVDPPSGQETFALMVNSQQYDFRSLEQAFPDCTRYDPNRGGETRGDDDPSLPPWLRAAAPVTGWRTARHQVVIIDAAN